MPAAADLGQGAHVGEHVRRDGGTAALRPVEQLRPLTTASVSSYAVEKMFVKAPFDRVGQHEACR